MSTNKNLYTEDSIESLDPLAFTRLRPQVYAGDTTYSTQLLVEIISNAVDEFRLGHGNKIEVYIYEKDNTIVVQDYGQGFICNSFREDGKSILEAAFSVLNTSGKYREDGAYEGTSLGSFGIGSKITNFLSHCCTVTTNRDGLWEEVSFKEGEFVARKSGKTTAPNGTKVVWQPSEEFFTNTSVELPKVKSLFKTIVCLCPGLTIELTIQKTDNPKDKKILTYYSKNGLNDLVDEAIKDKEIIKNRCEVQMAEGKNKMDFILTYTSNYSMTIVPYVNTGLTEKGPHITQIKTLITREFNKFFREERWLKEKDANLSGEDIQEGMYIVFNLTAPNIAYDAQVKSTITKIDMKPFTQVLTDKIQYWLSENKKEVKAIADKAISARKAREAAKKARDNIRNKQNIKKKKALKFDSKLADCYSQDRLKCEVYVTEGDSASGNLKTARNNEYQAVIPVRGKILNVRKATLDKIQKNAEIMTMIEAFGLKVDLKTMKLTFDRDELRYGKIIIMSDADVDGSHIKNLFYTFIWTFCPKLIEEGYVYAGVPPLYCIEETKDKIIYLKDDNELEEYKQKHIGKNFKVKHLKGLGEMDAEETEVLVNPEQRIIKQITVEDVEKSDELFDDLMGGSVLPRKEFIKMYSKEAKYAN